VKTKEDYPKPSGKSIAVEINDDSDSELEESHFENSNMTGNDNDLFGLVCGSLIIHLSLIIIFHLLLCLLMT